MHIKEIHMVVAMTALLIFVFSGCQEGTRIWDNTDTTVSDETYSSAQDAINPEERLPAPMEHRMNWDFVTESLHANWEAYSISAYTDDKWELFYLGMTANRILQTWNAYVWNPDGSSYFEDVAGDAWRILFQGDAWMPGARAVCQAFQFDWAFPDWDPGWKVSAEKVEGSFGSEIEWIADEARPHYLYREKLYLPGYGAETEVTMKVFTNGDGTRLLADKAILLQAGDCDFSDVDIVGLDEAPLSRDERSGDQWSALNRYIEFRGMSETEFLTRTEYPKRISTEYDLRYKDAQGVVYDFSRDQCSFIRIPVKLIFSGLNDRTITRDELLTMMNAKVDWMYPIEDYGYGYSYYFDDCDVFFNSDENMEISGEDEIWIKMY
jgi:hypothetical protein